MKLVIRLVLSALALAPATLQAGELPSGTTAKFVTLISKGAGENGKVLVKDDELAAEVGKAGGEVASNGKVAWASNLNEIRALAMMKKCVIVGDPKGLSLGAGVAIYEDGGKIKIALNQKAISASGVTLSDAILKAAMGN